MSDVFGGTYAAAYDALYGDKDYAAEVELLERLFETYGEGPVRTVLDLGCGTGSHAVPLAERGYRVVGVDRSEAMLAQARRKAEAGGAAPRTRFVAGDVTAVQLEEHGFDAALLMFAVLGYQRENADVRAALGTARAHLRHGGLLVFDVWYGPAVLTERPAQRVKSIPTADGEVVRLASGDLDARRHLTTVHYEVWRLQGERLVDRARESHAMRFFFPRELELYLELSGFELVRLGAFPEVEREPDASTWNVTVVARAV